MTKDCSTDAYWEDDMNEAFPDWDGSRYARALPTRGDSKWRPPPCHHWREPVSLRDGITVFASGWFDRPDRGAVDLDWADIGFYLDGSWSQAMMLCSPGFRPKFARYKPSKIMIYPWPDLGVPRDPKRFVRALKWLLAQAAAGQRIEIGCAGGHGRTGTTLAGLLVLQGMTPSRAIQRVRREYCSEAVETRAQVSMLQRWVK